MGSGLKPTDIIRLTISGSRGGEGVTHASGLFNSQGVQVDEQLKPILGKQPLDLSKMVDKGPLPEFPTAAYQSAQKLGVAKAQEVIKAHQEALVVAQGTGGSMEDSLIDAVLNYCESWLGYSIDKDDTQKFVVNRKDVVVNTEQTIFAGTERRQFTVRLASRFG
jgi:hypothetical protein